MYRPGVRQHLQAALNLGATKQELMEVLELSATLSIHVFSTGLPILMEVLEGAEPADRGRSPHRGAGAGQGGIHEVPRVLEPLLG
jgi:hypothetical protein